MSMSEILLRHEATLHSFISASFLLVGDSDVRIAVYFGLSVFLVRGLYLLDRARIESLSSYEVLVLLRAFEHAIAAEVIYIRP